VPKRWPIVAPDGLTLEHHRDLKDRERRPVARWILLGLLGVFIVLGLLNVFGQRPASSIVASPVAELKIYSPKRVRSGVYFESRFTISARREIEKATLVLDPGWVEGMTLNTVEPAPVGEASRNGRIAFELGRIPPGDDYIFFLHFQVNPTHVGHRSQDVWLYDGERLLATVERAITVWP
jgi:hypothetical protein